ncbi:MAG: glycosyltransferase [Candidatus Aureabacteria bacterium]|nr:glycosyltransferase [Candidatus Auribacterota bacterium]
MKIGIGIATFNRLPHLQAILHDLSVFPPSSSPVELFVSDDGSTDGTVEFLKTAGIEFTTAPNAGISWSKNRIITRFWHHDYTFIIEDDIHFFRAGWVELFINAMEKTGENHLSYIPENARYTPDHWQAHAFDEFTIMENYGANGVFMALSKKALHEVGGFDTRFILYGHEHSNLTERVHHAGLNHFVFAHLKEAETYMTLQNVPSTVQSERSKELLYINQLVLYIWGFCLNNQLLPPYCPPWPEITFSGTSNGKTGIGIIVSHYTREQVSILIESIRRNTNETYEPAIFNITKDKKGHLHQWKDFPFPVYTSSTLCGAFHKNVLLAHFKNHQNIILLEEGCLPALSGWLTQLVKSVSPKNNCCGIALSKQGQNIPVQFEENITVPIVPVLLLTHEALKKTGGFDERFIGCGMETEDFFRRAGLLKQGRLISSEELPFRFQDYFDFKELSYFRGMYDIVPRKNKEIEKLLHFCEQKNYLKLSRPFHELSG